jgi:hypothetical protein
MSLPLPLNTPPLAAGKNLLAKSNIPTIFQAMYAE